MDLGDVPISSDSDEVSAILEFMKKTAGSEDGREDTPPLSLCLRRNNAAVGRK